MPGIAQDFLERRRAAAVLPEEPEGWIEPRLTGEAATLSARPRFSGPVSKRRQLTRSDDQQRLLEARIEAGKPAEIGACARGRRRSTSASIPARSRALPSAARRAS